MNQKYKFTPEMDEYIRQYYPNSLAQDIAKKLNVSIYALYNRAFKLKVKKSKDFNINLGLKLANHPNSISNRIKKGDIPFNKGMRREEYMSHKAIEKVQKTEFKKGNKPFNAKSDGEITIRSNHKRNQSYKYIRVSEGEWKLYHRFLWHQINGPIPKNMNVTFKDGNSMNCVIENLELKSNDNLMADNSIQRYPKDLRIAMQTTGKLISKIKNYGQE